jgi:ornithine decarboxylase
MNNDPGGVVYNLKSNIFPLHAPKPAARVPARRKKTEVFPTIEAMVRALKPQGSVHVLRPESIRQKTAWFLQHFPGDVLFAVKTNPDPRVLAYVHKAGLRHYDVASIAEVRLVAAHCAGAQLYFMHPVKSREAIAEAYFVHGVRHFSLDTHEELAKILEVTRHADDLCLYVRLAISNHQSAYDLSGKFGVKLEQASSLMQATRKAAHKFGICFHVGSQCMDPAAFTITIGYVRDLLTQLDVRLDMLDVGGGFPSIYPGMVPPAMHTYMDAIREGIATLPIDGDCRILCEPGRALVAEGGSTVVRVELRKGNALYINDGAFGSLFDAAHTEFNFPVKAVRTQGDFASETMAFTFYGPTCDSMDAMKGPFILPADINEGDWIEIGQLGAYGATMATRFNGFHSEHVVEVKDEPLMKVAM